jgi:hypothetical protein
MRCVYSKHLMTLAYSTLHTEVCSWRWESLGQNWHQLETVAICTNMQVNIYCKPWNFHEPFIFVIYVNAVSNANFKDVEMSNLMHITH